MPRERAPSSGGNVAPGAAIRHHKAVLIGDAVEKRQWQVDVSALARIGGNEWMQDFPQLLGRDLTEMAETFPHWFLAVGKDGRPAQCPQDGDYIVASQGQLRCAACEQPYRSAAHLGSLIWTGMIPVQVTGAAHVEERIRRGIASGNLPIGHVDSGALFILAPIEALYPSNWPHSAPVARYLQGFFEALGGSPGFGHASHMLRDNQMCLFSSWRQMSMRDVIQNRVVPHALAQVKIANGERPQRWFS